MGHEPSEPAARHVWVRGLGDHGEAVPGVVVAWQPAPARGSAAPPWVALVASAPFGDALLLEWVGTDRLVVLRDARAVDGR